MRIHCSGFLIGTKYNYFVVSFYILIVLHNYSVNCYLKLKKKTKKFKNPTIKKSGMTKLKIILFNKN